MAQIPAAVNATAWIASLIHENRSARIRSLRSRPGGSMSVAKGASGVRTGERLAGGVAGTGQRSRQGRSWGSGRAMLRRMLMFPAALVVWSAATTAAAAPVTTTDFVSLAMDQERAISRCTAWVESQHARELDSSGRVKDGRELFVVRRFLGLAPAQRVDIVSASRQGQDVAEEMRKQQKLQSETQKFRSPFHPDSRPLYMFFRAESALSEPMRLTFHPTYAHRNDAGMFEGTALLDRTTGRLLEWTASLVNPPTLVSKVEVHARYGTRVGLLDARSDVSVDIEGGLLFYKRRGRMDFRYTDYRCPESMPPPEPVVAEPGEVPVPSSGPSADRGS